MAYRIDGYLDSVSRFPVSVWYRIPQVDLIVVLVIIMAAIVPKLDVGHSCFARRPEVATWFQGRYMGFKK